MCMASGMWEKKSAMRQPSWMWFLGLGFSACTMSGNLMPSRMKNTCTESIGHQLQALQQDAHALSTLRCSTAAKSSKASFKQASRQIQGATEHQHDMEQLWEAHWEIVANQVPVALAGVELDLHGKPPGFRSPHHVALQQGRKMSCKSTLRQHGGMQPSTMSSPGYEIQ